MNASKQADGIVLVSIELAPWFKITGVADLLKSIIAELARRRLKVVVICPDFGCDYKEFRFRKVFPFYTIFDETPVDLIFRRALDTNGVSYFLLEDKEFSARTPDPQMSEDLSARCWLKFCYATYLLLSGLVAGELGLRADSWAVHIFHWQTAPLLRLIRQAPWRDSVRTVLTADVLEKQGRFSADLFQVHEIFRSLAPQGEREVNLLRMGLDAADVVHTVSPNYARQIQHPPAGRGLEMVFRQRFAEGRLIGILNGLDPKTTDWRNIPCLRDNGLSFELDQAEIFENKQKAKAIFQELTGLPKDTSRFLISMGHRFVKQKNFEVVARAMDGLMALKPRPQIYLRAWPEPRVGEVEWPLWWELSRLAKRYRHDLAFLSPFDRDPSLAAEKIYIDRFLYYAASDLFLMPSLWEPCGLCQLEAMRYGAIPVVSSVGGLVDTVEPYQPGGRGWGFRLNDPSDPKELIEAIRTAMDLWASQPEVWQGMVRRAMAFDSRIETTVDKYLSLLYSFEPETV